MVGRIGGSDDSVSSGGLGLELGTGAISGEGIAEGVSDSGGAVVSRALTKQIHEALEGDGLVGAGSADRGKGFVAELVGDIAGGEGEGDCFGLMKRHDEFCFWFCFFCFVFVGFLFLLNVGW